MPEKAASSLLRMLGAVWLCSRGAVLALLGLSLSCSDPTVVVGKFDSSKAPDSGANADAALATASDGLDAGEARSPGAIRVETAALDAFCAGSGPSVRRSTKGEACTANLERELFGRALCACETLWLGGDAVTVDGFDSSAGAYVAGEGGAAIGANDALVPGASDIVIRGDATASGPMSLPSSGMRLEIGGNLKVQAAIEATGTNIRVDGDAWFGGDISGLGPPIAVGGDAYQRPGMRGFERADVSGLKSRVDFAIEPACPCGERLDIAAIVAAGRAASDNVALGVPEDALGDETLATRIWTLPCGRIALTDPTLTVSTLRLAVRGRSALFIAGNLTVSTGTLLIDDFGPDAELDIFVSGDVELGGALVLGTEARPSALRLFVGGEIRGSEYLVIAARIYAPRAALTLAGVLDAYGSVLASDISTLGRQRFHHDRAYSACSSARE